MGGCVRAPARSRRCTEELASRLEPSSRTEAGKTSPTVVGGVALVALIVSVGVWTSTAARTTPRARPATTSRPADDLGGRPEPGRRPEGGVRPLGRPAGPGDRPRRPGLPGGPEAAQPERGAGPGTDREGPGGGRLDHLDLRELPGPQADRGRSVPLRQPRPRRRHRRRGGNDGQAAHDLGAELGLRRAGSGHPPGAAQRRRARPLGAVRPRRHEPRRRQGRLRRGVDRAQLVPLLADRPRPGRVRPAAGRQLPGDPQPWHPTPRSSPAASAATTSGISRRSTRPSTRSG